MKVQNLELGLLNKTVKTNKICRYIFARHNVLKKVFTGLQICERSIVFDLLMLLNISGLSDQNEREGIHSLCFYNVFLLQSQRKEESLVTQKTELW